MYLQENTFRKNLSYYEPLLQFIANEMSSDQYKDIAKMSRNEQEQFFKNRVDVLVADFKNTVLAFHQRPGRLMGATVVTWGRRENY